MKPTPIFGSLLLAYGGLVSAQNVVISQVYGGGGNSGAPLTHDYVELFNAGSQPVSLAGWSVQYASAAGSTWSVTPLSSAVLQPGQYYLVQQAAGAGSGSALPAPDAAGGAAMSARSGKVALVSSGMALSGASPSGATLVDLVGYGGAGHFEGSSAAPALSNTTAALRTAAGCTDTQQNGIDFSSGVPAPRNSATAAAPCGGAVNAPIVASCPTLNMVAGTTRTVEATARDADGIVISADLAGPLPAGVRVADFSAATGPGGWAGLLLEVAGSTPQGSYPVPLSWRNNQGQTADCTVLLNVSSLTRIPTVQGTGATSPLVGATVTTEGVVTLLTNNGFFLQDATGDGNPATSDGLFVFTGTGAGAPRPAVGSLVRLTGRVSEFNTGASGNAVTSARPVTQLGSVSELTMVRSGVAVAPTPVALPASGGDALERYEGMLVTLPGPITVSQNYFLGRYGQLTMSVGGRLETPTNRLRPGPQAQALAEENARRSFLLDDATGAQNPTPIPYIGADNTVRAGDTVASLTGVLDYGLATSSNAGIASYKLHPSVVPSFTRNHPRSAMPETVGGNVRVASFNVLNYFTTFTDGTNADGQAGQGCTLGDSTAAGNCRGASNAQEFERQRRKIVEAMVAIDADVFGLMEIQNNGMTAAQNLVDALNARLGTTVYAVVPDPATGTGTDAIKVAMIYKPGRLSLAGSSVSDDDAVHNRPPLAQVFEAANGERFAVVVNHFKSKGCDGATGADADQGDLQGCWNALRVQQARALGEFIVAVQALGATEDVLVIGDLNAYAQEDPVVELTGRGYVDEIARHNGFGYSYVFDGAAGRLDHALASASLSPKVTRAIEWHINADEPSVIDYNLEFKPQDLYAPTAYRSSDHDPVVVGLNLVNTVHGSRRPERIAGTPGDDQITGGRGPDFIRGGGGNDVFVYRSLHDGVDVIDDFRPGDRIDLRSLLRQLGFGGGDAVAAGYVRLQRTGAGVLVMVDVNGVQRRMGQRPLLLLRGVKPSDLDVAGALLY
ncbi:ExeM/NucH family extracellular endonuclease [Schlegelella sp. S2-27]|uniref:ExeM/NucH family extracellular endonuclease n=1 Tax=Caldimonas mangrovi TaxID=2944811 RepID=A0ABT0YT37_9BURK|nr:ExeM/NucH family extracellular endonuclease [Caldimonas mangrovi]MCM5681905.1 ExeM/NucH family extracellular endonuclease [Caldimonas mangrovi]